MKVKTPLSLKDLRELDDLIKKEASKPRELYLEPWVHYEITKVLKNDQ